MPKVSFIEKKIKAPTPEPGRALNFKYNPTKLEIWVECLEE